MLGQVTNKTDLQSLARRAARAFYRRLSAARGAKACALQHVSSAGMPATSAFCPDPFAE
jgi:hypothetical protein